MRHAALALFVLCCSCATILAPGPDILSVSSEPPGATVFLRGTAAGTTPMHLSIQRVTELDYKCPVAFQLAGFHTQAIDIQKVSNGWVFLNLITMPLGFVGDALTGHWIKVPEGEPMHVVLVPTSQPAPPPLQFPFPAPPRETYKPRSPTDSRPAVGWTPASE